MVLTVQPAASIENLRKYAAIVVDAKSGEPLYEAEADSRRYPASLSKVMTLYVVFQELKAGNLSLSIKLTVSKHAANAVPTKLGLKAGSQIALRDAMKSLVTLSANDMARTIAEHISGTEAKFAERMTATARALGMARTTYRNASGLPDGAQITTVRDQAILAVAILQHFPEYYELFQTTSFKYGGKTYGNHNRVLGYMGAVDGIKTGYINASGSNLMTAARKDGRHVVVIAFGFNSGAARDQKVRELLKEHFSKGSRGEYLEAALVPLPGQNAGTTRVAQSRPVFVTPMPLPGFRLAELLARDEKAPERELAMISTQTPDMAANSTASSERHVDTAAEAAAALVGETAVPERPDVVGAWLGSSFALSAHERDGSEPMPPFIAPVSTVALDRAQDDMATGSTGDRKQTGALSGWHIQLGATSSEEEARKILVDAAEANLTLNNARAHVEIFERHGQQLYRARYIGFGTRELASSACASLAKRPLTCLVVNG